MPNDTPAPGVDLDGSPDTLRPLDKNELTTAGDGKSFTVSVTKEGDTFRGEILAAGSVPRYVDLSDPAAREALLSAPDEDGHRWITMRLDIDLERNPVIGHPTRLSDEDAPSHG